MYTVIREFADRKSFLFMTMSLPQLTRDSEMSHTKIYIFSTGHVVLRDNLFVFRCIFFLYSLEHSLETSEDSGVNEGKKYMQNVSDCDSTFSHRMW